MNTPTPHSGAALTERKAQHLEICLDAQRYAVETSATRLEEVRFIHRSLPEIDADALDTGIDFFGKRVRQPFFISSMTGGSDAGFQTNKDLAAVAEAMGIAVGMGSIRILFRKPEVADHFLLKRHAPNVPVFANIGGVQLRELDHDALLRWLEHLRVDGLAVHLNPAQELFQPDGDRDFRGVIEALERFVSRCPLPIMVKETGCGINPAEVVALKRAGAQYVNLAGAGGTSWIQVEAYRATDPLIREAAAEFQHWGIPTAELLVALGREQTGIVASGGIRSGMDVAKAVALGAHAVGLALPFIRALKSGGVEGAIRFAQRTAHVLRTVMVLTGSRTIADLRRTPLQLSRSLREDAAALNDALAECHREPGLDDRPARDAVQPAAWPALGTQPHHH